MQPILIYTIVLGSAGLLGFAVLTNEIIVDPQDLKVFDSEELPDPACLCEGEDGSFSLENCNFAILGPEAELICNRDTPNGGFELVAGYDDTLAQGCPALFWKDNSGGIITFEQFQAFGGELSLIENSLWPEGYYPWDNYADMFGTTIITVSQGEDPTLYDALSSNGVGIDALARNSVAAMLNVAHSDVQSHYTMNEVLAMTQIAIASEDYDDTSDEFFLYNGMSAPLCP